MDDDRRELVGRLGRHHRRIRVGDRRRRGHAAARPPRVLDADGCLVTPGLVNTHHHLFQNLTRAFPPMTNAPCSAGSRRSTRCGERSTRRRCSCRPGSGWRSWRCRGAPRRPITCTSTRAAPATCSSAEIAAARELGVRFHPTRGSMSLSQKDGGLPPDDVVQDDDVILAEMRGAGGAPSRPRAGRDGAHRARRRVHRSP